MTRPVYYIYKITHRSSGKCEVEAIRKRSSGKYPSIETRRRMSESHRNGPRGKDHPNFGRRRTLESIRKQVLNSLGKTRSEETRRKQSLAQLGSRGSGYGRRGALHPQAKSYRLQKVNGAIIEFVGLAAFCRENPQYCASTLSCLANGIRSTPYKDVASITARRVQA